jgi:hypothetical protein
MGSVPGSSAKAGSGIFNIVGDVLSGFSQQGAYDAQAQIARNNAIIARQNAGYAAQEGEAKGEQLGLRTRGRVAEIAARQAGSGLDPNSGSALDVRKSAGMLGALDALTARSQAAREAYGYQVRAQAEDVQSQMARKAAKIAPLEGGFNAIGSLLSTVSSLQGMYGDAQRQGLSTAAGLPLDNIFGSGEASSGGGGAVGDFESMFG